MSTFQVQLQNIKQGTLDMNPTTNPLAAGQAEVYGQLGIPFTISKQRQIFVCGPDRVYILLKDGQTFSGSNYWKRFAYPQVDYPFAFIAVLDDDGSVYSDVAEENTFGAGSGANAVTLNSSWTTIDFVNTYGGPARFLQVQNVGANTLIGELNGDTDVTFALVKDETQIFNHGDLMITKLRLKSASGTDVRWMASVKSSNQTVILS